MKVSVKIISMIVCIQKTILNCLLVISFPPFNFYTCFLVILKSANSAVHYTMRALLNQDLLVVV